MWNPFPLAGIFGLSELIVVGLIIFLLFGPKAARTLGSVGRTILDLKKQVDDTKKGIKREVSREIDSAIYGPAKKDEKPPESPRP